MLLVITDAVSQTLVKADVSRLAARDTLTMRLRHSWLHSAPEPRTQLEAAFYAAFDLKCRLNGMMVLSQCSWVGECGVSEVLAHAITHER